jgi:hypothetical protein
MKYPSTFLIKAVLALFVGGILILTIMEYAAKHKVDKDFATVHKVDTVHSEIKK